MLRDVGMTDTPSDRGQGPWVPIPKSIPMDMAAGTANGLSNFPKWCQSAVYSNRYRFDLPNFLILNQVSALQASHIEHTYLDYLGVTC